MRILVLAATIAATALPASMAQAQYWGGGYRDYRDYQRDVRREVRDCRRDLRRADTRREYRRAQRECRRDLREARRDYRRDLRDNRYGYSGRGYYDPYYGRSYNDGRRYWDGYRWRYRY